MNTFFLESFLVNIYQYSSVASQVRLKAMGTWNE